MRPTCSLSIGGGTGIGDRKLNRVWMGGERMGGRRGGGGGVRACASHRLPPEHRGRGGERMRGRRGERGRFRAFPSPRLPLENRVGRGRAGTRSRRRLRGADRRPCCGGRGGAGGGGSAAPRRAPRPPRSA